MKYQINGKLGREFFKTYSQHNTVKLNRLLKLSPRSLCRIGLFKQGESNQRNYKWIWPKSSEIIERRKWSWKNPGIGDWEIRTGLSRALVKQ